MSDSQKPQRHYLLALGSSLGDKLNYLQSACQQLSAQQGIHLLDRGKIYLTPPVGAATATFANSAITIATGLAPVALLKLVKSVETQLGRQKRGHWQDREIDIDLLLERNAAVFYNAEPQLWLPHRLMMSRSFVLAPAKDIAGDWRHPYHQATVSEAWQQLIAREPQAAALPTSPWPSASC